MIVSDHGEAFGEHGSTTHRQLFQEELHVPLLIRPPGGLPATVRVAGTLPMLDLAPTILWAVGLPAPPSMEGTSLLPPRRGGDTPVLSVAGESKAWRSLVLGEHQVIVKAHLPPAAFDLAADPGERVDLVTSGKLPAWAEAMLAQLEQFDADAARRRAVFEVDTESHAPAAELSPDVMEELQALGYVH